MRAFIATVVALFALWGIGGIYIVNERQQALPVFLGAPKEPVTTPGPKWRPLGLTEVIYYDKRILSLAPAGLEPILRDNNRLEVDAFVRWQIIEPLEFFKSFGSGINTAERRITSILGDELRAELGQRVLKEVLASPPAEGETLGTDEKGRPFSHRAAIMQSIGNNVDEKLRSDGIRVVDVRIRRADLPSDISNAIYQRMNTQRKQEAAEIRATGEKLANETRSKADREVVETISEAEQTASVLRGEGDREAIRIYAESFGQDPEFYAFYRSLEAYRTAMENDTTLILDPDSPFFQYFNAPGVPQ
ncbi:MAG: protease modulator HflC [Alphaproteobacteria bacterium]